MTDNDLKKELVETTLELYHAGVVTGKGGNLSVRSLEYEGAVWITPSQIHKGSLTPDQMVLIDVNGKKLQGKDRPSMESAYHAGLMAVRTDVNAMVHTHAPMATVWGVIDMDIPPITPEAVFIKDYPRVHFYMGGTKDLANAVLETLGESKAAGAFLCHHGLVTVGNDLVIAAERTMMVEHTLKIIFTLLSINREPHILPENDIKLLLQM
jgi:L-fuculose-phosphate aldolase